MQGRTARVAILAALSLVLALVAGVTGQTPAQASVTTAVFAGTGTAGYSGDGGAATSAKLYQPSGMATDGVGNVYIFDSHNLRIRKVNASGTISTVSAGNGAGCSSTGLSNSWGSDSSGVCNNNPYGLTTTAGGQVLFTNAQWLEEIYAGGAQYHIAGKVTGSYTPDDGTSFGVTVAPYSLVADSNGGVYFGENSTSGYPGYSVKYLDSSGNVTTVAGKTGTGTCSGTYANNGDTAIGACLHPDDLAIWSHYLYFYDNIHGFRIFRIDLNVAASSRTLQLVAGNGTTSCSGNGGAATSAGLCNENEMAFDAAGDLYVVGGGDTNIRWINTSGTIDLLTSSFGSQNLNGMASDGYSLYVSTSSNEVWKVSGLLSTSGNLVGLGDSVAAGEGINYGWVWNGSGWTQTGSSSPSWVNTTTALGANYQQCHQSGLSYVNHFAGQYNVYNMACTGASALQNNSSGLPEDGGVLDAEQFDTNGQPYPQIGYTEGGATQDPTKTVPAELGGWVSPRCSGCDAANTLFDTANPGVVLLTMGANDLNFAYWLYVCYNPVDGACNTQSNSDLLSAQLSIAKSDLTTTLSQLDSWAQGKGKTLRVLVTNYYDPFDANNTNCIDYNAPLGGIGITGSELTFLENGLISLNGNISSDVTAAQTSDTHLNVSLVDLSNVMSGHQWCTSDPWAYGASINFPVVNGSIVPGHNQAPFHPTPAAQNAIYQAVKSAI